MPPNLLDEQIIRTIPAQPMEAQVGLLQDPLPWVGRAQPAHPPQQKYYIPRVIPNIQNSLVHLRGRRWAEEGKEGGIKI